MSKRRSPALLAVLILVLALAACAPQPAQSAADTAAPTQPAPTQTNPPTQASLPTDTAVPTQPPAPTDAPAAPDAGSAAVSFAADVLPIFQANCAGCHGSGSPCAGLDLSSYASVMAGSRSGAVVKAGDSAGSRLFSAVQSGRMPPGGKLSDTDLAKIRAWIEAGAPDN